MYHSDRRLESYPTICDMLLHCGRQLRTLQLAGYFDRWRATSIFDSSCVVQMTTSRQVQGLLPQDRADLAQSAYRLMRGTVVLFFKPPNDSTPRDTERSFQSTQATALLIGPKNLVPSFGRVSGQLRVVATLASTGAAAIFLLAIWRDSVLAQSRIATMTARHRCRIHGVNPFISAWYEQYTTPFG